MTTATVTALVVGVAIVGIGVLVNLGLLGGAYAQTAIGVILGSSISGGVGFALGKKAAPTEPPTA